ncbi:MAG TPA: hypothetical protein VIK72_01660 [Clostridiaceae bacterium]
MHEDIFLLEDKEDKARVQQVQKSDQSNKQDMDQQQKVDVKPSQVNLQHLTLNIKDKLDDLSGSIEGITYNEKDKKLVSNFRELPPGFYSLKASLRHQEDFLPNIKLLPEEVTFNNIYMKKRKRTRKHRKI